MTVKARAEISLVGVSDGAKGDKGDTGAAGNGIKSTAITYQASTSNTTAPTGTWSSTIPSVAAGSYLWTKTVITYTNGTTSTSYSVAKQGATGATGAAGADGKMLYGTCATAAGTAAKVATATGFKLVSGTSVSIKFTYTNTAASPTLNVNSLGAKAIYTNGTRYAYWAAGATVTFVYDGTNFQVASVPVYANTATVGNPASGNVYIDNDSVDIRQGSTVNASFGSSLIELGKNSTNSQISMCGGVGTIGAESISGNAAGYDRALTIKSGVLQILGQSTSIGTSSAFYTNEGNEHNAWSELGGFSERSGDGSHWSNFNIEAGDNNSGCYASIIGEANEIDYDENGNAVKEPSGRISIGVGGEKELAGVQLTLYDGVARLYSSDIAMLYSNKSSHSCGVGIGAGGVNRGLWDGTNDAWMVYRNDNEYRTYINGLSFDFCHRTYTIMNNKSMSATSYVTGTTNISEPGFRPFGIVGFHSDTRYAHINRCYLSAINDGSGTITWMVTNWHSSSHSPTCTVRVLWIQT